MLIAALETEIAGYIESHEELVDEWGYRLVVRNGKAAERTLVTGAGALKVRAPRINDRREEAPVQLVYFAQVCASVPEGGRRATRLVSAGTLDGRLHPRIGGVLRVRSRVVGVDDHPTP